MNCGRVSLLMNNWVNLNENRCKYMNVLDMSMKTRCNYIISDGIINMVLTSKVHTPKPPLLYAMPITIIRLVKFSYFLVGK